MSVKKRTRPLRYRLSSARKTIAFRRMPTISSHYDAGISQSIVSRLNVDFKTHVLFLNVNRCDLPENIGKVVVDIIQLVRRFLRPLIAQIKLLLRHGQFVLRVARSDLGVSTAGSSWRRHKCTSRRAKGRRLQFECCCARELDDLGTPRSHIRLQRRKVGGRPSSRRHCHCLQTLCVLSYEVGHISKRDANG